MLIGAPLMNHSLEIRFPLVYSASNLENIHALVSVLKTSSVLSPHPTLPILHVYNLGQTWDFSEERPENGLIYSPTLLGRVLQEDCKHDQVVALKMLFDWMQTQQNANLLWDVVEHRWEETLCDEKWWDVDPKDVFNAWSEHNTAQRSKRILLDNIESESVSRTTSKKM